MLWNFSTLNVEVQIRDKLSIDEIDIENETKKLEEYDDLSSLYDNLRA